MEYTELGSTGLEVSVLSLGAGGSSKLGLGVDKTEAEAQRVVDAALDHGITLIDTAEVYGTETIVGRAIEDRNREDLVLSTKFSLYDDGDLRSPDEISESVDGSLERLQTDYIDVYHLHGVPSADYDYAATELYPALEALRDAGKIRHIGITETVSGDPGHDMLTRAVEDGRWDVVMVGFNLLNHSARDRVLEPAAEQGIGTIGMVAVRTALADPDALREEVQELLSNGTLDPESVDPDDPFGFLIHDDGASNLIDAAYRFSRHEPTIDTVLTGTANLDHLAANVDSVSKPPLPAEDVETVTERFGDVDSTIGN